TRYESARPAAHWPRIGGDSKQPPGSPDQSLYLPSRNSTITLRFLSTRAQPLGPTIKVDSRSSTIAGPANSSAGLKAYRSYTGVSTNPDSGKKARRDPFRSSVLS